MGFFNIFGKTKDEKTRESMKSLCFGIVGDTSRLLSDIGYNKPIYELELIIFAMFIVTEAYTMANINNSSISSVTNEQLDHFHLDLLNHVINEHFLKENRVENTEEVLKFRNEFYEMIQGRYLEYRPPFKEDINDLLNKKVALFGFNTSNKFLKHLFVVPLNEAEVSNTVVPMSLKLLEFYMGCVQSFI